MNYFWGARKKGGQVEFEELVKRFKALNFEGKIRWTSYAVLGVSLSLIVVVLVAYAINFRNGISPKNDDWGTFGDFFGGIMNPFLSLAGFVGLILTLLYTIEQTKESRTATQKTFKLAETAEIRNTILNLMNSFREISNTITVNVQQSDGTWFDIKGKESFHELYKHFEDCYFIQLANHIIDKRVQFWKYFDGKSKLRLNANLFDNLGYKNAQISENEFEKMSASHEGENLIEAIFEWDKQAILWTDTVYDFRKTILNIRNANFLSSGDELSFIKLAYTQYFKDRGHLVGYYYRNLANTMEYLNDKLSQESKEFGKFIRSHFSGFEIVMLFYNCLSKYSDNKFNSAVKDHQLLDDIELHPFVHNHLSIKKYDLVTLAHPKTEKS